MTAPSPTERYGPALLVSGATGLLLFVTSGRYGYHRDELYFLAAGKHLAWGYPDQPLLTPHIARVMSTIAPHSLIVLRLPSTISAALVVLLAGVMASDLGARRSGQYVASASTALTGFVLAMGHLLSTSTTDLLGWTLLTFLLVRLAQGADERWWLLVGLVAGLTLLDNSLVVFLLVGAFACLLALGPCAPLRSAWFWFGAALMVLGGLPFAWWQATHGWPELEVSSSIAAGNSTSSAPRPLLIPLEIIQASLPLLPIWLGGLRRLWRDVRLRYLAATFGLLNVVFIVLGGKPYYLAGLFPLLLAAGSQRMVDRVRAYWLLLVLSLPVIVLALPLVPISAVGPVLAINPDAGETIGWPQYVSQIRDAYRRLPTGSVIITDNYGEAGAVDRFGPALGLPHAYSGHNAYGLWAIPPGRATALLVGIDRDVATSSCRTLKPLGHLNNSYGIDNGEQGTRLESCVPDQPWSRLWPRFKHVG